MIADVSVFPFVVAGGVMLAVVAGVFVSIAVLVAGVMRRRKRSKNSQEALPDGGTSDPYNTRNEQ